ncbi:hypothetical protein M0D21_07010 [Aquimarina sp. D1M17]|uniref:hypothetical protein n=1 Tax=Aquimarina acroporae TaxID=2937283 RepID=UPI0020BE05CD|nr:hypothetical protein [Aquimarina acroporae]MCK8521308.1 hypothetical protein [Aquimarina acroporae]
MITKEVLHKLQLVDGVFTPSEATDVINSLIREKINFHKLHRLSMCEGNEHSNTEYDDNRVSQLLKEKENCKTIYKEALLHGKRVRISGILEIEIID